VLLGGDAGYYYSTPGIDGRVHLVCVPAEASVSDVAFVTTLLKGHAFAPTHSTIGSGTAVQSTSPAELACSLWCRGPLCGDHSFRLSLSGATTVTVDARADGGPSNVTMHVPNATLWWPTGSGPGRTPFLNSLRIDLIPRTAATVSTSGGGGGGASKQLDSAPRTVRERRLPTAGSEARGAGPPPTDSLVVAVGMRTISVSHNAVLVNGEPVYLRGADTHQDALLRGHGVDVAAIVSNLNTMRGLGMNSFRFNSWPAPEELLNLCDKHGFLVQEEVPGIALRPGWDDACPSNVPGGIFNPNGHCANASTHAAHAAALTELVRRDRV
jgi:beta-galactosidase/beta-glucuronidase